MKEAFISRRKFLVQICQTSTIAPIFFMTGCTRSEDSVFCAPADQLSSPQKSYRAALQYTDRSADPDKTCKKCVYYQADQATAACGLCQIFNGPVSAMGHCTSWGPIA